MKVFHLKAFALFLLLLPLCGAADVITGNNSSAPLYQRPMGPNMNNPDIRNGDIPFVVDEVERDEICNQ